MPAAKPRAVPAFYDVDESPPLVPLLSSQTEICYHPMSRVFVSANEDMTIAKLNVPQRVPILRATPAVPRASTPGPPQPSTPLVVMVTGKPPVKAVTFTSSGPSESPQSDLDLESEVGNIGKIPKPNSEAGRPRRGGYNLEEQLGWGEDDFKTRKRFVNKAIKKHLDVKKCRAVQDCKALEAVQDALNFHILMHTSTAGLSMISSNFD
ncbi:hypothetical protein PAXINDRAFT_22241 [Paxillus involutus ATCC 200175]|uniref:Unplaced genomic scaffold PAXINscaffold_2481, whole genome shotgun sequence n=1 Tax=Paxillus involutus ATCC 200175 TaxID=664439 RepID=A0A0C9SSC3_PAXIN|nr:hypothetical protein PAXINDRAFT_22241 [Paxillus involutus ATCC 200175]